MRWIRIFALTLLAAVLLIAATVVVLVNLDANQFKADISRFVQDQTGRSFKITGSLDLDLGQQSRLTVSGMHLGNPEWAASDDMVQLDEFTIVVDVWSLLKRPFVIELFELSGARINLEKQQDGKNNWTFGGKKKTDSRSKSKPIPLVVYLARIDDLHLTFVDPDLLAPLQVHVTTHEQRQVETGMLEASLKGHINDRPIRINGQYGPLNNLLAGRDVDYQISGEFDTLTITSDGHIDDILQPTHPELTLTVKGPDIDHVTDMLGLTDMGSGNLDVDASLRPQGDRLEAMVHGNLGEYFIDADAYSSALTDLQNAELRITANGPNLGQAAKLFGVTIIPDEPFDLDGHITRSGKIFTIEQIDLNIGGGHFGIRGSMTQFPKLTGSTLDLSIAGSDIGRFREIFNLPGAASGPFSADAELIVSADGMENLDVQIRAEMGDINISGILGEPPEFIGTILNIEVSGDNLHEVGTAYGINSLIAEPFKLAGKIEILEKKLVTHEKIRINAGNNSLEIDGTVGFDPLARDTNIHVSATGSNLSQIATMAGIDDGVPYEPYTARGQLQVQRNGYRVRNLDAKIGDAEIILDGLISRKPLFVGSAVNFTASGPDLEDLLGNTELIDFASGPFRAAAIVELSADEIQIEKLELDTVRGNVRGVLNIIFPLGWSDFQSSSGKFDLMASGLDIVDVAAGFEIYQPDPLPLAIQATGAWDKDIWRFDKFDIDLGDARFSFQGQLDQPPDWSATEIDLDVRITSLAKLGMINSRRLPDAALDLAAHFSGTTETFEMDDLTAHLGQSDFSGQLALSLQQQVPDIDIQIQSEVLNVDSLTRINNVIAASTEEESSDAPDDGRLIPDQSLSLDFLRKFNAHLAIDAKQLLFRKKTYRELAFYADVANGSLNVHRAEAAGDDGSFAATFVAAPQKDAARITGSFQGTNLFLGLAGQTGDEASVAPRIDAQIDLTGTGRSVRELATTLNASARFTSKGGRIPNTGFGSVFYGDFFTEVFNAANPFSKEDPYTEVVCLAVLLEARDGKVVVDPGIVLQTGKMNIVSKGVIDLVTEDVDLNFRTASRGKIGVSAGQFINPYIKVAGTMANPKLQLDPEGTLVSGGAAVATMGLSILAKMAWDRVFRSKDPCGDAIAEADKRRASRTPSG